VSQLFRPVKLHEPQLLAGSTRDARVHHDLGERGPHAGPTNVLMEATEKGQTVRLLFSGDVGRKNLPIIKDPILRPRPTTSSWRARTAIACTRRSAM